MDVLIGYHWRLVEGWLLIMVLNLLLPSLLRGNVSKRILYTRIGYFAFWALWSMTAFSGLMVWLFAGRPLHWEIGLMIALFALLPVMDGVRAFRLAKLWRQGEDGVPFSSGVVGLELLLAAGVVFAALARQPG